MSNTYVSEKKYYEDRLADQRIMDARDSAIKDEFWKVRIICIIIAILASVNAANVLIPMILRLLGMS